jgi:ubiquinone/menaquinone biosynthesis C-methylase UbiE
VHNTCSVTLDLFGGRTSQIPGATNVDIIATDGIKANALELPFVNGSIDEIIISNPYLPPDGMNGMTKGKVRNQLLAEINRVLTDEGVVYINTQESNPFTNSRSRELERSGMCQDKINN